MENEAMNIAVEMDTLNKNCQKKGKTHKSHISHDILFLRIIYIGIIIAETKIEVPTYIYMEA
jgi:hypothetical protein